VDPPTRIEIEGGTQMLLVRGNGTEQRFSARELRASCPCAACNEPDAARRLAVLLRQPIEVKIGDAELVGYGINLTFRPDGHRTGIFSYDYLRSLKDGTANDED